MWQKRESKSVAHNNDDEIDGVERVVVGEETLEAPVCNQLEHKLDGEDQVEYGWEAARAPLGQPSTMPDLFQTQPLCAMRTVCASLAQALRGKTIGAHLRI